MATYLACLNFIILQLTNIQSTNPFDVSRMTTINTEKKTHNDYRSLILWNCPPAAVCTALQYDAWIFLFPTTTPSYWNKSSQQQITWSSQHQSELVFHWWWVNSTGSL